jgi:phosphoglycerate dehydrogenase-like enzyme
VKGGDGVLILYPDAQFVDDAELERTAAPEATFAIHRERSAERIPAETWRSCDAIITYHEVPIEPPAIARLERCRIIVRAGVGYDQIDVRACGERGIPVCNVPDYGTTEVADHAIALMLALARGVIGYHTELLGDPEGNWHWSRTPLIRRLRGATFGVVGLGRIGTAAARRARALDMEVAFYDPYLPDGADLALGFRRYERLNDLLAASDVVSLHCPRTEETADIIGAGALAAIKPGAILINTARGGLIDLDALMAALRDGRVAAAGLDVLPQEPPDRDWPLLRAYRAREPWLDNRLILTPHGAWYSHEGQRDLRTKSLRTVLDYLREGKLRNCVNGAWLKRA